MTDMIDEIQTYINSGQYQEALELIESMPEENQKTAEIQNLEGLIFFYQGEYDSAKSHFEAVLDLSPTDEDCIYNLAYILYQQKETDQLREMIEKLDSASISSRLKDQLSMWLYELSSSAGKKVLMIAYYYPPLSGSGVFRSLKFSKYLHCYGWQPTVVSAKEPPEGWNFRDDDQMGEIPDDVEVIRIDDVVSCQRATDVSVQNFLMLQGDVLRYDPLLQTFFQQYLQQGEEGIRTLLSFPMHDAWWCGEVVSYLEKNVDLSQFDAVYTTSGPYSEHLVGFYLQRKYHLPWIADYRDQWTGNPFAHFDHESDSYKIYHALERLLLQHADLNITIMDSLIEEYQRDFQLPAHKITAITNGYDEEDFQTLQFSQEKTPRFTITYSGLLYSEGRDISPILNALSQLIKSKKVDRELVSFLAVGSGEQDVDALANRYGLSGVVYTTGYVSHHDALQYNVDSNLLLLLVGDKPEYKNVYTGKIFDYLRSGKPILAIAPSPSVVEETLQEAGHGYVVQSHDINRIKDIILKEYMAWLQSSENTYLQNPMIEQFERKYLTGKLAMALEKACEQHVSAPAEFSSEIYDAGYRNGGAGNTYRAHYTKSFYYPSWKRALAYFCLLNRDTKILEIGCGVGQCANMLFDAGFTCYQGLDFSAEAIQQAQIMNASFADKFVVGDAFETPLLDGDYDIVIFFEILEHLNEDLKLVSRVRPGRKVLLSVPNFMDPYHVRCFANLKEVCDRYSKVLNILDTFEMPLTNSNKLFYIVGERL